MIIKIEIDHPQAKNYTQKELEIITLKLVNNYLDLKELEKKK